MKVLALILLLGAVVARAEKDVETKIPDAAEAEVVVARDENDQETPAAEVGDGVMAPSNGDEIPELIGEVGSSDVFIASTSCADGWTSNKDRCFYFGRNLKSWTEARSYCQRRGGDLARGDTYSRNRFITLLAYGVENVWIGLSDLSNEGHFHWVGTDEHAEYENWKAGQPDNKRRKEDCVMTNYHRDGLWNDANCESAHRYVCERSASACNA